MVETAEKSVAAYTYCTPTVGGSMPDERGAGTGVKWGAVGGPPFLVIVVRAVSTGYSYRLHGGI